jgi:SAM-dependent methyltransferase
VLDIGAGTGDLALALRASYPNTELAGIDISEAGLELARRKVPGARFIAHDLMRSGDAPAELEGWATHAVCSEVLEHVDEPERLLKNVTSYLAPGCRLVVTVPGGPMSAFDRHIGHRRHFAPVELGSVLERAGFTVETVTGAGFPFYNLYRLAVIARGRRLIADAEGDGGGVVARIAGRTFALLFHLNVDWLPWGWQTVATARWPGDPQ